MRTERPTCRECACVKVCEYFQNENARNLDEVCPLCNWENYFVPKQEWISVDERLPEPNVECLVAAKVGNRMVVDMGELIPCWDTRTGENYCEWMITNDWDEGEGCEITHWMPIPEPPKMKGGAE